MAQHTPQFALRQTDFPTSVAGKGHDTGVVCRWLQYALEAFESNLHPPKPTLPIAKQQNELIREHIT